MVNGQGLGKACPFSSSAIQNLIIIAIFKMVLRDTLFYDSENWSAYQPFPVLSLFLCWEPSFVRTVASVIKEHEKREGSEGFQTLPFL